MAAVLTELEWQSCTELHWQSCSGSCTDLTGRPRSGSTAVRAERPPPNSAIIPTQIARCPSPVAPTAAWIRLVQEAQLRARVISCTVCWLARAPASLPGSRDINLHTPTIRPSVCRCRRVAVSCRRVAVSCRRVAVSRRRVAVVSTRPERATSPQPNVLRIAAAPRQESRNLTFRSRLFHAAPALTWGAAPTRVVSFLVGTSTVDQLGPQQPQ